MSSHKHPKHGARQQKKRPTAALFMGIIGLLFGLSFGWFTGGLQWHWSLAGGMAGVSLGYLFGRAIDRSFKS